MDKTFLKDGLGWGFLLWLVGYVLSIMLFMVVSPELIGWIIAPIGVAITLWVLFKKIKVSEFRYYLQLGIIWTAVAVVLDYLFIVQLLKPEDGYYKPAVYLYYSMTLGLPLLVGWYKSRFYRSNADAIDR